MNSRDNEIIFYISKKRMGQSKKIEEVVPVGAQPSYRHLLSSSSIKYKIMETGIIIIDYGL